MGTALMAEESKSRYVRGRIATVMLLKLVSRTFQYSWSLRLGRTV